MFSLSKLVICGLIALHGVSCDEVREVPVKVDLVSSWTQTPFELSTINGISKGDPKKFYALVGELANKNDESTQTRYEHLLNYSLDQGYITKDDVEYLKIELSNHYYSAEIQAGYQYFDSEVAPTLDDDSSCSNVLLYNGKHSCDVMLAYALESTSNPLPIEKTPMDIVYGENHRAPVAILYTDTTGNFAAFHEALSASADRGKIQYILRFKRRDDQLETLTGYGVSLNVKRTDYLVVDDRDDTPVEDELELEGGVRDTTKKQKVVELKSSDESSSISKADLHSLGFRAAKYIMSSKNPFESLLKLSLDFPKYLASVSELLPDKDVYQDSKANAPYFSPGSNHILINGAPVSAEDGILGLLGAIDQERRFVSSLEKLGMDASSAANFITSNVLATSQKKSGPRYDYITESLVWLNDVEKDPFYARLPIDIKEYFMDSSHVSESIIRVRKNTHSIVLVADLADPMHFAYIGQLFGLLRHGIPIQIGIIPLADSPLSRRAAQQIQFLFRDGQPGMLPQYIMHVLTGSSIDDAFSTVVGDEFPFENVEHNKEISSLIEDSLEWCRKFGISTKDTDPLIFANGVLIPATGEWLVESTTVFENDFEFIKSLVLSDSTDKEVPIREHLLANALNHRNEIVFPKDPNSIDYVDTRELRSDAPHADFMFDSAYYTTIWVIGDLGDDSIQTQLDSIIAVINEERNVRSNIRLKFVMSGDDKHASLLDQIKEKGSASIVEVIKNLSSDSTGSTFRMIIGGRALTVPTDQILTKDAIRLLINNEESSRIHPIINEYPSYVDSENKFEFYDNLVSAYTLTYYTKSKRLVTDVWSRDSSSIWVGTGLAEATLKVIAVIDPLSARGQEYLAILESIVTLPGIGLEIIVNPKPGLSEIPIKRFYRALVPREPSFDEAGNIVPDQLTFDSLPIDTLLNMELKTPNAWIVNPTKSIYDLENIILDNVKEDALYATYGLRGILIEGSAYDVTLGQQAAGISLRRNEPRSNKYITDTIVMENLGYFQLKASPGKYKVELMEGRSRDIFHFTDSKGTTEASSGTVWLTKLTGLDLPLMFKRKPGTEAENVLKKSSGGYLSKLKHMLGHNQVENAEINIFSVASGHLYERFLSIMTDSVMRHTNHTVKFWLIEDFLSPSFKEFLPHLAENFGFQYELVTYKWPSWLRGQTEKQRTIWGYKILFLDVLFPLSLDKVIFVDADQIVRTDLKELVDIDLQGAPYGYTPMCDSRQEMEGFRFWKQGYWKSFLHGEPYHISALYVIDLDRFREIAAGDRLRARYQTLSADPNSLSNLDQDLPNNMQFDIPIFSLPQEWLWCETWCSDEALKTAKTIDLCNNPLTKEPKLDRARRQIPEWTVYDNEIAQLSERVRAVGAETADKTESQLESETVDDPESEPEYSHDDL